MADARRFDQTGIARAALAAFIVEIGRERFLAEYGDPYLATLADLEGIYEAPTGEMTQAGAPRGVLGALPKARRLPKGAHCWAVRKHSDTFLSKITLGRGSNNDIVIPHRSISKFHAFFARREERWTVCEAGSKNQSRHNGMPITSELKPRALSDGDALQFGAGPEILWVEAPTLLRLLFET